MIHFMKANTFAQRVLLSIIASILWLNGLALADQSQDAEQPATGTVQGTVTDPSGSVVSGAIVTLDTASSPGQRTTITDEAGTFRFSSITTGTYRLTITASGFSAWTTTVTASTASDSTVISAALQMAPASTQVNVILPRQELATQQLKAEEKQRLAGILPNYFVTYEPNPAPLSARQKFQLGWKTFVDPAPILFSGISAGVQQTRNSYPDYGQGAEGYFKRFGANYADRVDGILVGRVTMQAIFHQDPRYFYRGRGSFGSRLLYAVGTAFARKGDNGSWQPAYSDVLGGMAAYELSTLYRPGTSRPWRRLGDTVLLNFAGNATQNLLQEFVLRHITTHVPKTATLSDPVLRAGTPVPLISVSDLLSNTSSKAGPVTFSLASDLRVDGALVAKAGSEAWGRVTYGSSDGKAVHMTLERFRLKVGKVDVPLRSTQVREKDGTCQYHRLENSGRIAIVLYVDGDVTLPSVQ